MEKIMDIAKAKSTRINIVNNSANKVGKIGGLDSDLSSNTGDKEGLVPGEERLGSDGNETVKDGDKKKGGTYQEEGGDFKTGDKKEGTNIIKRKLARIRIVNNGAKK